MATVIRTERRRRGFFGWVFLILFWAFNALMAFIMFFGLSGSVEVASTATSDAERAGAAIGTAIGAGAVLFVWLAGAVILGLFTWLTAGRKTITETRTD